MILSLTGFMGCGKSCVGELLHTHLCRSLIDLDDYIEKKEGRAISAIFRDEGEAAFRKMETSALTEILDANKDRDIVLSLGGGTLTTPEAADAVRAHTCCVYLRAGIDTLLHNLTLWPGDRPMLGGTTDIDALRLRITGLMEQRRAIYESSASVIIDIDGKEYEEVAREIIEEVKNLR